MDFSFNLKTEKILSTVNSPLVDTPLLQTLAIMDKIQIPSGRYRGLTGNYSCYIMDSHYY